MTRREGGRCRLAVLAACLAALVPAGAVQLEDLFETNQYALLTQTKCQHLMETYVRPDTCPRFLGPNEELVSHVKSHPKCNGLRSHLIRDLTGRHPPRVITLSLDNVNKMILKFNDRLDLPHRNTNYTIDYATSFGHSYYIPSASNHVYVDSIFDPHSHILYIITREPTTYGMWVHAAYISHLFGEDTSRITGLFSRTLHAVNSGRFAWSEDPYEGKFYYAVSSSSSADMVTVYGFPSSRIHAVLFDGAEGDVMWTINEQRPNIKLDVSGGVFFSRISNSSRMEGYIRSRKHVRGILCPYSPPPPHANARSSVMVIRDWDYCMLRDGAPAANDREAAVAACRRERNEWRRLSGLPLEDGVEECSSVSFWLLAAVIALALLLFIAVVYILWLRRSVEAELEAATSRQPIPYYPTGGYGNGADMDITVDKWNY